MPLSGDVSVVVICGTELSSWLSACAVIILDAVLVFMFLVNLTHFCLMDFSILISWTSPFLNLGMSGAFFYFDFIFN